MSAREGNYSFINTLPYEWGLTSPHQKMTNRLTIAVTES
jgi:hypothetical protein